MEIDSGSQPERDKESDPMDTSVDGNASKGTHNDQGKQPEQLSGPELSTNPGYSAILDREAGNPMGMPEESAPKPEIPRLTQDVLKLYGLQPLVASVARSDPETGEKINKLRKSYENHLKNFCLAGRNKGVKADAGNKLIHLAAWPDEEFHNQRVAGKDVMQGLPAATLEKLEKAMLMQSGPVKDNNKWEDLLGHGSVKPVGTASDKKGKAATAQPIAQVNGNRTDHTKVLDAEDIRPKRAGKRRRYDDNSYEGYAEGFEDDDAEVFGGGGNSSDDHSRRGSALKRRKKSSRDFTATSPTERGAISVSSYAR